MLAQSSKYDWYTAESRVRTVDVRTLLGNEYSKQTSFLHGDKFIEKSTSAKIHFSVKEVASWFGKKSAAM